jgi:subfamily B ATP-binding cassette protein MsbA
MIWLMGDAINQIQFGTKNNLYEILLIFFIVVIINQSSQLGGGWIINELCLRFIGRCRSALFESCLKKSYPLISKISKGDIIARLSNDIDLISQVVVTSRLMIASHMLTLSIYIVMLFWININLALLAMAAIPLYLMHQRYFSPRKQKATAQFLGKNAQLLGFEEQCLGNLKNISSNTAESAISSKHLTLFNLAKLFSMKERLLLNGFSVSFMLLNYLVGLIIILVGVSSIHKGILSVGHLLSFILYLGYLTIPVRGIADIFLLCTGNTAAAVRVSEILSMDIKHKNNSNIKTLHVSKGAIDFVGVDFSYENGTTIFNNINYHLEGNKTYALVGPSGSGKSSLVNLLMRFYDPDKGCIEIDGINIREVSKQSLRSSIAVVWQDNFYINDTIRENLLLANRYATTTQIVDACTAANALQFIKQFPDGFETILGSNGVSLSGGQFQRLAIAQAFLKNTPIIILDEASSALDSHSEQHIVNSLGNLNNERTLLIIAHRYSSIKNADKVLYFYDDGQIAIANHDELCEQHSDYREAVLWQTSLQIG